ncbi:uncharacterized protein LOC131597731 [Vicia villosa]|uniref:uncharacterized protein LOC131597731 n=1 Tax=Vicia villosa TaxID=3911 RepID=UPI00273BA689|nr:uncharacterized protein LOC131597731 [Vicia villosa]
MKVTAIEEAQDISNMNLDELIDSDNESEEETTKHVTILTSAYAYDDDSSDDELTFDELVASYKKLCIKNAEVCKQVEKKKIIIKEMEIEKNEHLATIDSLNSEMSMLNSKLDQMTKSFRMLNNGTDILEEILQFGQGAGAHTSLRMPAKENWYLDSGCSNHMTGRKNLLVDIKLEGTSYVTLGDGEIREVKGVGKLGCLGVPYLNNVLLLPGLAANLISITQLCDEGFNVRLTKEE